MGEETRRFEKINSTTAGLLVLAALMGGGGAGTALTGNSIAGDLREAKAKIMGKLEVIENKLDHNGARIDDHEKRIRALEQYNRNRKD